MNWYGVRTHIASSGLWLLGVLLVLLAAGEDMVLEQRGRALEEGNGNRRMFACAGTILNDEVWRDAERSSSV